MTNDFRHYKFGDPAVVYRYTDDFVVARYHTDSGKKIAPWKRNGSGWAMGAADKPRPLYGNVDVLAPRHFIIVEGEKCVDHLKTLGVSRSPITWPGGAQAWKHADWQQIEFSDVLLFPDHDAPGLTCMMDLAAHLLTLSCSVKIIDHRGDDLPKGWDIADTDWNAEQFTQWARARVKSVNDVPQPEQPDVPRETGDIDKAQASHTGDTPVLPAPVRRGKPRTKRDGSNANGADVTAPSAFVSWESMGLLCTSNGMPHPHLANIRRVLASHPEMTGRIWYDEFHEKVFQTLFQDSPAEWADNHDTRLTSWMQSDLRLAKIGVHNVRLAVDDFARLNVRNEPREWLESLAWDGCDRLPCLMSDGFGAPQNDYTAAVGRCFMVSMVARVYRPGCKVDTMPVFEGYQGQQKSSALGVIGGKWFAEMHEEMTSKDFLQNLPGKMLIEIPELHAFRRADINRIKGIISCATDRYRRSYGRRAEDHPRRGVWSGSTNQDDWVQDDTGARRFWPVACGDISLDYLRANREQLFAEAVERFKRAESWWDIDPVLAKAEQDQRREEDPWSEKVLRWCSGKDRVRVPDILEMCLALPLGGQGKVEQMRIASILRMAGWKRVTVRDRLEIVKGWQNPVVTVETRGLDF